MQRLSTPAQCRFRRLFAWSGFVTVLVFVGSCLAAQGGAFRLGPLRHSALWLLVGCFASLWLLALAMLCAEAARALTRTFASGRFRGASFALSALAVAAGAALPFAYAPPGEPIFGAADQGIYLSSAIHLARTGSYQIEIPILRETPSALQPWVLGYEPAEAQRRNDAAPRFWNYHTGFVLDPQPEEPPGNLEKPISSVAMLNPLFPPGFPLLLAAAYDVGGWKGLALVNRALTILAAAFLGLLANRWLPARGVIGVCVFLVALLHPLNLWMARSFFAEPAALCFWLLAMRAWAQRRMLGDTSAGLLAGAALAAGLYLKFDALLVGSLTGLVVLFTSGFRFRRTFLIASAAVGFSALLAWWQFCWPTFSGNLTALRQSRMLWLLALGGLLAGGWQWWKTSQRSSGPRNRAGLRLERFSPFALAGGILLAAAYAYWIRPNPSEVHADYFFFWPIDGLLRSYREETFFRLGWYWHPLGLAAAVTGVALLGFRLRFGWQKAFFWAGLISLGILSYDLRNNPLQPYAMRRLLPAATPWLVLGAAAFVPLCAQVIVRSRGRERRSADRVRIGAALVGTAALLVGFAPINSHLNTEPAKGNFSGLARQTSELAQLVPPRSIVVIRRNAPLATLAAPLRIIEGIDTILIHPMSHSPAYQSAFRRAWQEWTAHGHRVFLLSPIANDQLDLFGARFNSMTCGVLGFPIVSQSPAKLNTSATQIDWDYFLEEIQLPSEEESSMR